MSELATIEKPRSLLAEVASRYHMEPEAFEKTLMQTVVPSNCTRAQFAAFLMVAREHGLDPLTREIYAFPSKGGGIQPIVSVDGWIKLIQKQPNLDGIEFQDHHDDKGQLAAITCRIHRKDQRLPTEVTEYMSECRRGTEPWKQFPARMLRHKALIQCARYAFGFSGIIDPDEFERQQMKDVTPAPATPLPPRPKRSDYVPAPEAYQHAEPDLDAGFRAAIQEEDYSAAGNQEDSEDAADGARAAVSPAAVSPPRPGPSEDADSSARQPQTACQLLTHDGKTEGTYEQPTGWYGALHKLLEHAPTNDARAALIEVNRSGHGYWSSVNRTAAARFWKMALEKAGAAE